MEQQEYIDKKTKEFAMNIDDFLIGQAIIDSDGAICAIRNKTQNTIEVVMNARISKCHSCNGKGKVKKDIEIKHKNYFQRLRGNMTKIKIDIECDNCKGCGKYYYGIDCANWFDIREFNKRFKVFKT